MRKFNKTSTVILAGLFLSASAPAMASSAAEEIRRINESIAVLSAKKQELQLQVDVAGKQADLDKIKGTPSAKDANAQKPIDLPPAVLSIEGMDGRLTARVVSGGVPMTVRVGDYVNGGWKIDKINTNSVAFARGKHSETVSVGSAPIQRAIDGGQPAAGAIATAQPGRLPGLAFDGTPAFPAPDRTGR